MSTATISLIVAIAGVVGSFVAWYIGRRDRKTDHEQRQIERVEDLKQREREREEDLEQREEERAADYAQTPSAPDAETQAKQPA